MKTQITLSYLFIVFALISCKKEDSIKETPCSDYNCYESIIAFSENHVFQYQEINYYQNDLLIKKDCTPSYVWNYEYDNHNNIIKFESEPGNYTLNSYDDQNRCTLSVRFIQDTLYEKSYISYTDTLIINKISIYSNGDTNNVENYYYTNNLLDSVISNSIKEIHNYLSNNHSVCRYIHNNTKIYESIETFENGLTPKFEEYKFNENGELIKSIIVLKEYDEEKRLVKWVLEQYNLFPNTTYYEESRYSYDQDGKRIKIEFYDLNGNLVKFKDFIYEGEKLIKIQSFDSVGNKIGYTLVDNTCN